jgi:hypothetical protein
VTLNTASREPVRGSGWLTAVTALLTLAGIKLAGLDPGTAGMVAAGLAPALVGEVGRRLAFSPATVATRERKLLTQAHNDSPALPAVPPPPLRDPGWLRRYWPVGLAVAALAFVGPEAFAIAYQGDGGTLSEWTRDQLGTSDGQATIGWWALTAVLAGFAVWFPVHLRHGWPWERQRR